MLDISVGRIERCACERELVVIMAVVISGAIKSCQLIVHTISEIFPHVLAFVLLPFLNAVLV